MKRSTALWACRTSAKAPIHSAATLARVEELLRFQLDLY